MQYISFLLFCLIMLIGFSAAKMATNNDLVQKEQTIVKNNVSKECSRDGQELYVKPEYLLTASADQYTMGYTYTFVQNTKYACSDADDVLCCNKNDEAR